MTLPGSTSDILLNLYYLIVINLIGVSIEIRFVQKYVAGKIHRGLALLFTALLLLSGLVEAGIFPIQVPMLFFALHILLLFIMGNLLTGNSSARPRPNSRRRFGRAPAPVSHTAASLMAAVIAETGFMLANGLLSPIAFLLMPFSLAHPPDGAAFALGLVISIAGPFFNFALELFTYHLILKYFRWTPVRPNRYFIILFFPVLFLLFIEQYIANQVYGNMVIVENNRIVAPVVDNWQILIIQIFAYFSFFCVLYACRMLTKSFAEQTSLALMEQEFAAQKEYLKEAQTRYEQTKAFRHDIRSHLTALGGLLESGDVENAKEYLKKLDGISDFLSFPCKTGNSVVDILLSSKLSAARQKEIEVECSVKIPSPCAVDDLDLCVLFSNAVDNAVSAAAALSADRKKYIRIASRIQGAFYMLEVENSCASSGGFEGGTGFSNMEAVAAKYDGAVTAEMADGQFRLSILLVISRRLSDISTPPY